MENNKKVEVILEVEDRDLTESAKIGLIRADQLCIGHKKFYVPVKDYVDDSITKESTWFDCAEYSVKGTMLTDKGEIAITAEKIALEGAVHEKVTLNFPPNQMVHTIESTCRAVCAAMNDEEASRHERRLDAVMQKVMDYEKIQKFYHNLKKAVQ